MNRWMRLLTSRRLRSLLWLGVVFFAVLYVSLTFYGRQPQSVAGLTPNADYGAAPEFALTDHFGEFFDGTPLSGKVWAASFIFTRCLDECPVITARLNQAAQILKSRQVWDSDVRFVSLTVDPEYDTPQRLAEYAARFGIKDGWYFLTGDPDVVRRTITEGFRVTALRWERSEGITPFSLFGMAYAHMPEDETYGIMHTERIAIVDREGRIRTFLDAMTVTPQDIAAEIGKYL